MKRRPKGYRGENHQTIGSDIQAVLDAMTLPEQTLGQELVDRLRSVEANGWYPIEMLLEAMEVLDRKLGYYGLVRMGRRLWTRTHEERLRDVMTSASDVVFGMDDAYHHANRGSAIGGWKVVEFEPGRAVLEKTTPHHCAMEEGILTQALQMVGAKAVVTQTQCLRRGAPFCIYEVVSSVRDHRWMGEHPPVRRTQSEPPPPPSQ